ncbi:MAG: DUF423 domain-containing protein [Rhizobiaceae bacterium]|nr:DUF423 domain-containing protein [Rhizobiaceae bacterium]
MTYSRTIFILFAGLFGASGVGGAAVAAHGGDDRLAGIAAAVALVHAPTLLALAALPAETLRMRRLAGGLLILGVALFSGDLAARLLLGDRLFANAAPAGGMILIVGWLAIAAGAIVAAIRRGKALSPDVL